MTLFLSLLGVMIGLIIAPFFFMGVLLVVVGRRMKRNMGPRGDQSAFWSNYIAFIWGWAEQGKALAAALPFFQKDLTENFDIRPDDGKVT